MSRIVEALYRVYDVNLYENISLNESAAADLKYIADRLANKFNGSYSIRRIQNMGAGFETRRLPMVLLDKKVTLVETASFKDREFKGRIYRVIYNRKSTPGVFWPAEENEKIDLNKLFNYVSQLLTVNLD